MKKIYKLFISTFIFVFIFACMSMAGNAFAADATVAVSSSDFLVHEGESFTTTIYIPDNANIVDFDITVRYDNSLVTLTKAEENEDIKGSVVFNTEIPGEIAINYSRTSANVNKYMPVLDLTFSVDENIGIGAYDCLSIDKSQAYVAHRLNNQGRLDEVDFTCDFAKLVIYEIGDVDLSEKVDIGDATYIRRHLAEFDGAILTGFKLSLADTYSDGVVDIADAVCLQRHLARLDVLYGNRINVTFVDINGDKYASKSVVYDGTLHNIPAVPAEDGYAEGEWSQSPDEYIEPVYNNLTKDITLYPYYKNGKTSEAIEYYKKLLSDQYYQGDMPTNLSSDLNLWSTVYYQEGYYANLIWNSDCNYVVNSTTGKFTKPVYPKDMKLTAKIISYDSNNRIEGEDSITFDYAVPGEFITPSKASVEDFLKYYFTDDTDGKYRINYDVKLITKLNNTVIPVEGSQYDNFEIRLDWYQNVNGTLTPISQVKRTTSAQTNDYVAVATFNGKPLEGDGKIYIDDVEVTPIQQIEIKNYIINQIAANQGTLATNGISLWNNDTVYGTNVTWETGNNKIAYVANNKVQLKDDAVTGSTLPLNARVSYAVDGGTEEFVLSYNLTVSCDNTIIKAPENMDPGLYKAIKMELEDKLGYRGDLTSAALANVQFVNLDLSEYQKTAKEYNILRAEHPEQYPDDLYPEITSFRGLSYCTNLRTLNISGIEVTDGSMNQIATLSYLEAFIARDCNLDNLSDGGTPTLKNAVKLRMLDLTDNNFTNLDSVFASGVRYGSLREVYLSNNKLTDINALSRAPMMTYLSLSGNGLTTAGTTCLANYPYLQYLSLADNKIDSVENLKGLKYLIELRLQNNQLTDVRGLRGLVNLEILYLGHNQIRDIGFLNSLTALQILYANDNAITDVSALNGLSKLELFNVNNNRISNLAVLRNYKDTLTEVYAENNNITDFSFINGASKLHILMLAGNKTELAQDNMTSWLAGLADMEVLTLSDIKLNDLSFLEPMTKLVRLDVANCGISAFSGDTSNIQMIADKYATLRVLDISNNDMHGSEQELLKLRNVTLLTVFYADNICDSLDAYTLTYSMPELRFISIENCGITSLNWLFKYNNLIYVDLAGNKISDVNFEQYISNASIKTLDELYLDTTVPCTFTNAYRTVDFNVRKLSLEGVSVKKVENLPYLDNINYLNLTNTGITNLVGEDEEYSYLYSLERYGTVETLDLSGLQTDLSLVKKLPSLKTLYAVDVPANKMFFKDNLYTLQYLYNKGVTCYLYDKETQYKPTATKEGKDILNLIDDISCDITVAADNMISDNNPFIINEINDYDITWSLSNSKNYEIVNNHLSVKDYAGIEDEELIVTASIKVYPDQAPVTRDFKINTHILRASAKYYDVDITGYSKQLARDANFNYRLTLKSAETEGFSSLAKPVEDVVKYSYSAKTGEGTTIPYPNVITVNEDGKFTINSAAPLGSTVYIKINVQHNKANGTAVDDIEQIVVPVTIASRTFTANFVLNGGTLVDENGVARDSGEFVEDSLIFDDLTYERPGYTFDGWYTDKDFKNLFSKDGSDAVMPSHAITLYAKWNALSYNLIFDANGGESEVNTKSVLSDVAVGELPVPTRQYYTFDGWFTETGAQVTAESKFARTDDLNLVAHWTLNSFVITFDAGDGNATETTKRVYCSEAIGELPEAKKDYYSFDGWFTESGEQVTAESVYYVAKDITLYAHYTINPIIGWTKVDELPSDAQVVSEKWVYDLTTTAQSTASSMSGYTFVNNTYSAWSGEKSQKNSKPAESDVLTNTRSVNTPAKTHTEYHYYRWVNGNTVYTYQQSSSLHLEENWFTYVLPRSTKTNDADFGYYGSDTYANRWIKASSSYNHSVSTTWTRTVTDQAAYTTYYYKTRTKYYNFKKVETGLESNTEVTNGALDSNRTISNVQKWVQYREK